jgi:vacuolar-type H+-ATPase subunit E/Vma4
MALDDLIARLEQDADAQVAAIARTADEEVAAIAAAADEALSIRAREALAAARAARQADYAHALAEHRRQLRAVELHERHRVLDRVFARARELLDGREQRDAWDGLWPAVAAEALSYVAGQPCRMRAAPAVLGTLGAIMRREDAVEIVADQQIGTGLVVETIDGSVRIDATIETSLARRREALSIGLLETEAGSAA